jgi:ABC-type glycerol-3-phosphate transport system permease component
MVMIVLYYCIPGNFTTTFSFTNPTTNVTSTQNQGFDSENAFDSASNMASRAMADLLIAWPVILISAFIALIVSYIYISLSKHAGYCLVYIVILLILAAGKLHI